MRLGFGRARQDRCRVVGLVGGTALVVSLAAVPASAAPASAALSGVVVLDGAPVEGAVVTLTLMRGFDTPVARHREVPSAVVTSASDGTFRLPLNVTPAVVDAATVNGNYVNFAVQAFLDPAAIDSDANVGEPTGTVLSAADFAYTTVVTTGALTPAEELAGLTLAGVDGVSLELSTVATGQATAAEAASAVGIGGGQCRSRYSPWVSTVATENRAQPVGEVHANYDMTAKFQYGRHANTDLNGAYSFGGGSWEASLGANHMGNEHTLAGATYGPFQAYVVKTLFEYRKEKLEFTDDDGDGHVCRVDYRIRPIGWSGASCHNGENVRYKDSGGQMDAARGKGWASGFDARSFWTKNVGRTQKYRYGVEAFGVGLFSESNWSNQVDIHYEFGPDTLKHWLYGSNGPISSAEAVYAW